MKGFAVASPKLGNVGITVKIMLKKPSVILKQEAVEEKAEPETKPEAVGEEQAVEQEQPAPAKEKKKAKGKNSQ